VRGQGRGGVLADGSGVLQLLRGHHTRRECILCCVGVTGGGVTGVCGRGAANAHVITLPRGSLLCTAGTLCEKFCVVHTSSKNQNAAYSNSNHLMGPPGRCMACS
jgi:hypothetical protein